MDDTSSAFPNPAGPPQSPPPLPPGAAPTPAAGTFDRALRDKARTSWTLGLAAMMLAMIACGSYVTLLLALPLGLFAMNQARAVLADPALDATTEVYARTGQITGIVAALWSGLVLLLIVSFVVLYVGMIVFAIAAGNF